VGRAQIKLVQLGVAAVAVAVALLLHAKAYPAAVPSIPAVIISADCGTCPWHPVFAKALATSYVAQALHSAHYIDSNRVVHVVVESYEPRSGTMAVSISSGEDTIRLTTERPHPNPAAAIQALGKQAADALVARAARHGTPALTSQ
jgi:hypothetical protein